MTTQKNVLLAVNKNMFQTYFHKNPKSTHKLLWENIVNLNYDNATWNALQKEPSFKSFKAEMLQKTKEYSLECKIIKDLELECEIFTFEVPKKIAEMLAKEILLEVLNLNENVENVEVFDVMILATADSVKTALRLFTTVKADIVIDDYQSSFDFEVLPLSSGSSYTGTGSNFHDSKYD